MDAWDSTSFGNDTASDWLSELVESSDLEMIRDAFDAVLSVGEEVLEVESGEEGVAAAEVVATMAGRPGKDQESTEQIENWVDENELEPTEGLLKKARRVVDRVLEEPSELREQWEESEEFEDWKKALKDLKTRLG